MDYDDVRLEVRAEVPQKNYQTTRSRGLGPGAVLKPSTGGGSGALTRALDLEANVIIEALSAAQVLGKRLEMVLGPDLPGPAGHPMPGDLSELCVHETAARVVDLVQKTHALLTILHNLNARLDL